MKIEEYPTTEQLDDNDLVLVDSDTGTKTIRTKELAGVLYEKMDKALMKEELGGGTSDTPPMDEQAVIDALDAFKFDLYTQHTLAQGSSRHVDRIIIQNANNKKYSLPIMDLLCALVEALPTNEESSHPSSFKKLSPSGIARRAIWRGKNIGKMLGTLQRSTIRYGVFQDMFLGDYWKTEDGNIWRIVDFNYFQTTQNSKYVNHVVVMPDIGLYMERFHSVRDINNIGFYGCDLKKNLETKAKPIITNAFSESRLLAYTEMFANAVDDNGYVGYLSEPTKITLPSDVMMFGRSFNASKNEVSAAEGTNSTSQLAAFRICPCLRNLNLIYDVWLRSIHTPSTAHYLMAGTGVLGYKNPTYEASVRPVFALQGGVL